MKTILLRSLLFIPLFTSLSGFSKAEITLQGKVYSFTKSEIVLESSTGLYRIKLRDIIRSNPIELTASLVGKPAEVIVPVLKVSSERKKKD